MKVARWFLSVPAVAVLAVVQYGGAQEAPAAAKTPGTPDESKLVLPARTTIPLALRSTINSRTAYVGQGVYCETIFPIMMGNRIVIPKGSSVKGTVTQVVRPGRVKGKAQVGLRFDTIILPNGTTRTLRANLSGYSGTGREGFNREEGQINGASGAGQDVGKVAQTTVTGAELGTIVGAVKGSPLTGLGAGSAAGATGGVIWVLATRGPEVVLPPGTNLELELTTPLSFEREELEPPSRYDQGPALPRRDSGPGF